MVVLLLHLCVCDGRQFIVSRLMRGDLRHSCSSLHLVGGGTWRTRVLSRGPPASASSAPARLVSATQTSRQPSRRATRKESTALPAVAAHRDSGNASRHTIYRLPNTPLVTGEGALRPEIQIETAVWPLRLPSVELSVTSFCAEAFQGILRIKLNPDLQQGAGDVVAQLAQLRA